MWNNYVLSFKLKRTILSFKTNRLIRRLVLNLY